jgi:PII-like signaling protein
MRRIDRPGPARRTTLPFGEQRGPHENHFLSLGAGLPVGVIDSHTNVRSSAPHVFGHLPNGQKAPGEAPAG